MNKSQQGVPGASLKVGTLGPSLALRRAPSLLTLKKKKNLFIYFWPCWVFIAVLGFSLVAAINGSSSGRAHCGDLLFPSTGSRLEGFSRWGFSSPGSKVLDQ